MRTMQPVFMPRVWGGRYIPDTFHVAVTDEPIGEAWLLSDHPAGQTLDDRGRSLSDLAKSRQWFPVLIKVLHAQTDLSVQVHPNDEQAAAIGDLGKTEGWLILSAEPGARIVYGHHAPSPEAFQTCVQSGEIESCLRYVDVSVGDYYPVPAGTVHALGGGIVALEVQEASDTTYRLFDYHRKDQHGNLRELHVQEGLAVTAFPQPEPPSVSLTEDWTKTQGVRIRRLDQNTYYVLEEVQVSTTYARLVNQDAALCVILLVGTVSPEGWDGVLNTYQTWLFEPGETAVLKGHGTIAVVQIALA